jgi:hypothetical protein
MKFAGAMAPTTTAPFVDPAALAAFTTWNSTPVVSVFVPLDPTRTDADPVQLNSIAGWAEAALVADHGLDRAAAAAVLAPLSEAIPASLPSRRGAAWFLAPGRATCMSLPAPVELAVEIGDVADSLCLLPYLGNGPEYYVVAISQHRVRVFRCSHYEIEPVQVPQLPKSLEDALWYVQREPTFERHGSGTVHASGGGQQYHKDDIHQFLHLVDKALAPMLVGSHAPLVVMGVGYEASMFINESHYRHVVPTPLSGNPDTADVATIHQRSWDLIGSQPGPAGAAAARVRELLGTGRAVTDFDEIASAAANGAVDALVVARSMTEPGDRRGSMSPQRSQLARAVNAALAAGGHAYVVEPGELPTGAMAAAVLRY